MDLQVRNVKFFGLNVCIGCCFSKFNLWSHLGREAAEIQVITLNDMEILISFKLIYLSLIQQKFVSLILINFYNFKLKSIWLCSIGYECFLLLINDLSLCVNTGII